MRRLSLVFVLALATAAHAEVKLASLFTSNMVFQQKTNAPIWGWAKAGEQVTIRTTWGANATAVADEAGRWRTTLKTGPAGGPYEVSVTGENSLWLRNVVLGEVWICSGQSNMEFPVGAFQWSPGVKNSEQEVATAIHPKIRLFQVGHNMSPTIQETCEGSWAECNPKTVNAFSAVGYFFGRALNEKLNVPVGLIMTTWGGTEVELWTSEVGLKKLPELGEAVEAHKAGAVAAQEASAARKKAIASDPGRGWEKEDLDDSAWTRVAEPDAYEKEGMADLDGVVWYRAKLLLTADQAKANAILHLGPVDDEDETWINGVRVGAMTQYDAPRNYAVPKGLLRDGFNTVVIRTVDTGVIGGFQDPKAISLEAGDARIPLTNWRYRISVDLKAFPLPENQGGAAALLYNGMIAPLIPFAIKGALWYQGEANVGRAFQYRSSFPNMIRNWREDWHQGDFPFYFVQIAPFTYKAKDASAELREAQAMTVSAVPNTGMAVTMDVVPNINDIHPPYKFDVGDRLARLALNQTYGYRDIVCYGPTYKGVKFDGKRAIVSFDHASGLSIAGDTLAGIEIAGEDKVFHPAQAKLQGETLVVWSDEVEKPASVRFGFRDAVVTNLFNAANLPAPPFRSDDWPGVTVGVKW